MKVKVITLDEGHNEGHNEGQGQGHNALATALI